MSAQKPIVVRATWDEKAKVWVATSEDLKGLATEAKTCEALLQKLKVIIPELLEANGLADGYEKVVPVDVVSTLSLKAKVRASV